MGTMWDSVHPENLPAEAAAGPALRITVLADPEGECFDLERGNAPANRVADALAVRTDKGLWSVLYTNGNGMAESESAMAAKGLRLTDAARWPAPGVYLWAADPTGEPHLRPAWATVAPLACQHTWDQSFDVSETADNFPCTAAGYVDGPESQWPADAWAKFRPVGDTPPAPTPPAPPAPTPGGCDVQLPVLRDGDRGDSVRAVQTLVGGIAQDGIWGPVTDGAVRRFQESHHLTVDGIVGLHTWGALLGAPQ